MTHNQQLAAIRHYCHDGRREMNALDTELPADATRVLRTCGYLAGCLESILAECDREPKTCQRCRVRPADGSGIMCHQCWTETGDPSAGLDAELAALDRLAKGETP